MGPFARKKSAKRGPKRGKNDTNLRNFVPEKDSQDTIQEGGEIYMRKQRERRGAGDFTEANEGNEAVQERQILRRTFT